MGIPPRAAETNEPVVIVGAGAGRRGARGNGIPVAAREVRDGAAVFTAIAPAAPVRTPAPRRSTARRLRFGMGARITAGRAASGPGVYPKAQYGDR
ncbi:hypothetical protein MKOR_37110 [Mycolicibacillus koreensis]|nr:hypothetical protein MKOR_37110 [Mycolicibacillus koreensis]